MIASEPKAQPSHNQHALSFAGCGCEAISAPGHGGQYPEAMQALPTPSCPVPSRNIKYNTIVGEIGRICVAPDYVKWTTSRVGSGSPSKSCLQWRITR